MLNGKKICVTGTSRGIGLELVSQYLLNGNEVFAVARKVEKDSALAQLKEKFGNRLTLVQADVGTESGREMIRSAVFAQTKSLDILVNNAGVYLDRRSDLPSVTDEILRDSFQTNAIAPLLLTQALLPLLEKSSDARVANISSLMGSISDNGRGGTYAYRMSKVALNMFTVSFARDYPKMIALTLHPGWVQTDMGGKDALTSVKESVTGLIQVIERATPEQSGKFYDFEGDLIEW
jgi:NAD(P)-dependent dehydrogenase (short-subunit alcohol dehydrogenase family)